MKLPAESLTKAQKLEEFDAWITPYLGEVRKSVQFADRHAATVRAFDRLCQATNDFASEKDLSHTHLAENLVKLFPGQSVEDVQRILMDLANALFLISGKSGNSAKCQFPLFLKSKLKRLTIPKAKVTKRQGKETHTVEQKAPPRTIVISTYMRWVAELRHSPSDQRDLIDTFLRFVLDEDVYLTQLWSMGRSYALLKPLNRHHELLNPLIVVLVRGAVAAVGGHDPEKIMRDVMKEWGLIEGKDYNSTDVEITDAGAVKEKVPESEGGKKEKVRSYDFALPYKVAGWGQRLLIQSQYYAGDSGSVSHKTVDQAKASRVETAQKLGEVRFLEYLDGAGFFASLNTDLRTLLDMGDTAGIIQIRSTPIRLRREMQLVGFLTPLEIEHAILTAGTEQKKVVAALAKDGYKPKEIERALTAALKHGFHEQPNAKHLGIVPSRREQARRYLLLDMAAIEGRTLTLAESSATGLILVPGYGPFHGLPVAHLRAKAEAKAPSLKPDWSVAGVYEGDVNWLTQRGYAVANP
jgi:hypothetical protein